MQLQKHLFSFRKRLQPVTPFAKKCVMAPDDIHTQEHSGGDYSRRNPSHFFHLLHAAAYDANIISSSGNSSGTFFKKFIKQSEAYYCQFVNNFTGKREISPGIGQYAYIPVYVSVNTYRKI